MNWLRSPRSRFRGLFQRDALEQELDEEVRFHLEMQTEENLRRGMSPQEARRQALLAFGGVVQHKEACRDVRGLGPLEDMARDLRYALRRLVREPGFSVPAVATLALGIGVTAAVFALVHAVLLRPLPYPDAGRLVALQHAAPGFGIDNGGQSDGTFQHYRNHNRAFESMGVYVETDGVTLSDGDDPERVRAALVTASVLSVLRATPHLGGLPTMGATGTDLPTALISHDLWVRRYGADPEIVGRKIELNRAAVEVLGVLPAGFHFPHPETQVWYGWGADASMSVANLRYLYLNGIARLRDGVSPEEAEADLQRLIPSLADDFSDVTPELLEQGQFRAVVVPLRDALLGDLRTALLLLLATAGFLLLITWANVANLFLVRAERQRGEVAVQRALGARDGDLVRRFLSESLALAVLGGALGLGLAYAGVQTRFGFESGQIPRLHELRLGGAVVGLTAGLAIVTGLLLGAVSFARAGRPELTTALKGALSRVTASREAQRAQRLLVVLQVALALILLIGAAVMVQSLRRLQQVEMGFDPKDVLTISLSLPYGPYSTYQDGARFHERLLNRLREVPGVTAAGAVAILPLMPPMSEPEPLVAEDRPATSDEIPPAALVNLVTPGYFRAMRTPLVRGRTFRAGDAVAESPAVILSEPLARTLFRGEDPVGRRVRFAERPDPLPFTVVGVVGSVPGEAIPQGPMEMLFFPVLDEQPGSSQAGPAIPFIANDLAVVVRTSLPSTSLVSTIRRIVHDLDPKVPLAEIRTMEQIVDASLARTRLTMLLLLLTAGTALFLGVIGIYGVLSYTVRQRTSELGVRLALGASPAHMIRIVVRQGALLALAGIVVGLLAAFALTRFFGNLLYEVSPNDPAVFAAMAALLFLIALAASYVPARRAGRIDPARALRAE